MRLLCYADLQATDGDDLCFTQPNVTLQHYRVAKFFTDIARITKEQRCTGIVDLGDTTDDRTSIPWPTVEVIGSGISKLKDLDMWKITGNHEQYLRDISINNRRLFDPHFAVIDNRKVWAMNGWAAFFVSYPADHTELTEWLIQKAREVGRGPKVLFGHFQVQGAFYQGGKALTGVPLEALKPFHLSLLGHIHLPQSLSDNVHYVGSPFQQDWGETGQLKRVAIFDSDAMTLNWVPMEGYPEYHEITYEEFCQIDHSGEDRYRVVLGNHEETEAFFHHPHFNRATAKYAYDEKPAQENAENSDDWSTEGIMRRYIKTVPLNKVGINLTDDEMLEMAQQITS